MTTERLYEFVVLARTLNFSQAAQKLFMTQSALSRHIMELETEIDTQLFERNTHGVRLTQAGRLMAQRAPSLLAKSESAAARLLRGSVETHGQIRIACLEGCYHQIMIFLSYFKSKFRNIDLQVDVLGEVDRGSVIENYDLTVSLVEMQNLPDFVQSGIAFTSLGVLAVLPDSRLGEQHRVNLEDLAGETLLVPYADELFCSYTANRHLAEKLTNHRVQILKVPSAESAIVMVGLGRGVAIVPQTTPISSFANVWQLDIATPGCVFDTYLYWDKSKQNPAAALLMEELESYQGGKAE